MKNIQPTSPASWSLLGEADKRNNSWSEQDRAPETQKLGTGQTSITPEQGSWETSQRRRQQQLTFWVLIGPHHDPGLHPSSLLRALVFSSVRWDGENPLSWGCYEFEWVNLCKVLYSVPDMY
jgi:hypothetical protein